MGLHGVFNSKGNRALLQQLIDGLCLGKFVVDANGSIKPRDDSFCKRPQWIGYPAVESMLVPAVEIVEGARPCEESDYPVSCCCLCTASTSWSDHTLLIDATRHWMKSKTEHDPWDGDTAIILGTEGSRTKIVHPDGTVEWTAFVPGEGDSLSPSEDDVRMPLWLVFGHELCGHALQGSIHKQDTSIAVENQIRSEHSTDEDDYGQASGENHPKGWVFPKW